METLWQAWQSLSNLQISGRNYLKPGRSLPLVKDNNSEFSQDVKKSTSQSANDVARNVSERRQTHQQFGETHGSISVGRQSEWKSSMDFTSQAQRVNKSFSAHTLHTTQVKFSMDACGNNIDDDDDDDILEVIHVNQAIRFLAST